jgi:hypothetical protein
MKLPVFGVVDDKGKFVPMGSSYRGAKILASKGGYEKLYKLSDDGTQAFLVAEKRPHTVLKWESLYSELDGEYKG